MNIYDIERKLNDKADNYKVFDLENKNRALHREIVALNEKVNNYVNDINNLQNALRELIDNLYENNGAIGDSLINIKYKF